MRRISADQISTPSLQRIEAEVKTAPKRKQAAMNRALCEIGIRFPKWIAIGIRLRQARGKG